MINHLMMMTVHRFSFVLPLLLLDGAMGLSPRATSTSRRTFVGQSVFGGLATATSSSRALAAEDKPAAAAAAAEAPAAAPSKPSPANFQGEYWDPLHPNGFRTVYMSGDKMTIVGKDEPEGKLWSVEASVEGTKAAVDFSSKGGPKDVTATYADKFGAVGITFPDGNRWAKVNSMAGLYSDPAHPDGYKLLTVYPLGFGNDYFISTIYSKDGPSKPLTKLGGRLTLTGQGKLPPGQIAVDFNNGWGMPGMETIAQFDGEKLNFPEGTKRPAWTKLSPKKLLEACPASDLLDSC